MAADISSLLKTLAGYERRIALLERNQRVNNIANASIEGGALTVTDGAGTAQVALGSQPDGTFAAVASSPTSPLAPSVPVVAPGIQELFITWDGQMADGSTPLSDFTAVQVHVSQVQGFVPDATTLAGALTGPFVFRAGNLLAGSLYYVALVAVNMSGNLSGASDEATGTPLDVVSGIAQLASALNVTTAIAGIVEALDTLSSGDPSQVVPGIVGTVLLGAGAAAKQATVVGSPLGASTAAYMLLESENDGGTDTPVITLGTTLSPDDGTTLVYTPVLTIGPYYLLAYSGASGQVTVTRTSGSGTMPIPAGVTTVKAECWGGGGSGYAGYDTNGGAAQNPGGYGGEYACEPSLAVPSGGTIAYSVGAGGASSSPAAVVNNGGDTTITGTSVTVTAHGGYSASLSANTIHFNGGYSGPSRTVTRSVAMGGGSSGGPASAGGMSTFADGYAGTAGGSVAGGGTGGTGGLSTDSSANGTIGGAGSIPGGAGGAGGMSGTGTPGHGGGGASGQVRVTYSTGAPAIMLSVAAAAGTDQFGTAYPAGANWLDASGSSRYALGQHVTTVAADQGVAVTTTTITALQVPVQAGAYYVRGVIYWVQGGAANPQAFWLNGPAASAVLVGFDHQQAGVNAAVTATANAGVCNKIGSGGGASMPAPGFGAGAGVSLTFEGIVTLTAAGTLGISCGETSGGTSFTVKAGSHLVVSPA